MRIALLPSVVLLAATTGCASAPAPPLEEALRAAPRASKPSAYVLAVAPLEVPPEAAIGPAGEGEHWSPVPIDAAKLREALTGAAAAANKFGEVRFLAALSDRERPAPGEDAGKGEGVFRVPKAVAPKESLDAAFAERANLLLTLRVRKHSVRYVGRNGWFIPNLINFAVWVWPAWLVADEQYAGELRIEAEVRAIGSEKVVLSKTYEAQAEKSLDHFDRGWMLTGSLTVPGWLGPENYKKAGEVVLPHVVNEVATRLAADLAALGDGPEEIEGKLAHALAVCAGVGRYRAIPEPRVASDDAAAFATHLRDPARGAVAERNVVLLTEGEPTKKRILDALAERASRAGERDTLFLYFAGYGFRSGRDIYLVPHDVDPAKPLATAVSLAELAEALGACRAQQVIVLDTSFDGEPRPGMAVRTLRREQLPGLAADPADPQGEVVRAALERLAGGRAGGGAAGAPRRTVIVAARPGTVATEMSPIADDKMGLLTARLVEAAAAPATDADPRDGWITLAEAFKVAEREATRLSARFGYTQVPLRFGDEGKAVRLAAAVHKP